MTKVLAVAAREFRATVLTRGYIIGLLVAPAMAVVFGFVMTRFARSDSFQVRGELMVVDPTGQVLPELEQRFDPATLAERARADARRALSTMPENMRGVAGEALDNNPDMLDRTVPDVRIVRGPAHADLEEAKAWLNGPASGRPRLALVVIHEDAVVPAGDDVAYGAYDLYEPPRLDDRVRSELRRGLRDALISARLQARSIDQQTIDAITSVPAVRSVTVTDRGERENVPGMNFILPLGFGVLLLMAVMGGGGQLLTTMVEEKSSRVVEVLLSALSPMELMAGKLLGQMAVSLIGMSLYLAVGLLLLASFAMFGLLDAWLIFYLLLFFVITYLVMGSLMMAVGAAVNDMREAQGLLTPMMIVFMLPWLLWMPITRDPDSVLSLVASFLPPVNTFGMLLRMASNSPPPLWQVWLSIAIGAASALGAVWFAAKVFRIGLLMYGKPPDLRTLIRWVRAA
jgi:ABC-2 type transport system permease protein